MENAARSRRDPTRFGLATPPHPFIPRPLKHKQASRREQMSFNKPGEITLAHNSDKFHNVAVDVGDVPMTFEVGRVAKQASGSVWVRWGDSVVLVTVCQTKEPKEGI